MLIENIFWDYAFFLWSHIFSLPSAMILLPCACREQESTLIQNYCSHLIIGYICDIDHLFWINTIILSNIESLMLVRSLSLNIDFWMFLYQTFPVYDKYECLVFSIDAIIWVICWGRHDSKTNSVLENVSSSV